MATVAELRALAKEKGLRGYSKLRKAELEKLLGYETKVRVTRKRSRSRSRRRSRSKSPVKAKSPPPMDINDIIKTGTEKDLLYLLRGKTKKQQSNMIWDLMKKVRFVGPKATFKKMVEKLERSGDIELDMITSEAISDF